MFGSSSNCKKYFHSNQIYIMFSIFSVDNTEESIFSGNISFAEFNLPGLKKVQSSQDSFGKNLHQKKIVRSHTIHFETSN